MSPNIEPVSLAQDKITIRHIGPKAAVWPDAPGAVPEYTVLQRTDMVARPLSTANVPASPDFVSGVYNLRLDDAGDATVVFPNATSSDGVLWRERFDETGHCQFLEFYFDGELDFVGVIDQVTVDESSVTLHCDDAFWLLKKAYVRDWIVTQAPRDVIERATQVSTAVVADNFPAGTLNPMWTASLGANGTAAITPQGGLEITDFENAGGIHVDLTSVSSSTVTLPVPTGTWTATASMSTADLVGLVNTASFSLKVQEDSGHYATVLLVSPAATGTASGGAQFLTDAAPSNPSQLLVVAAVSSYTFMIESDGEWITGFLNGQLIGCVRRSSATATTLSVVLTMAVASTVGAGSSGAVVVQGVLLDALQPFAM